MADASTRPLLAIYVLWHPKFAGGEAIACALHDHYRRNLFTNVAGGSGLSVINRSAPVPGGAVPLDVDLDDTATAAVVMLLDENVTDDPAWVCYLQNLAQRAVGSVLRTQIYPVAMDATAYAISDKLEGFQYVRWNDWFGDPVGDRHRKLVFQLTYQFCRMLRSYLASLQHPDRTVDQLDEFLKQIRVFLSHSKHDTRDGRPGYGERIAEMIRTSIFAETELASFFDVRNLPPGLPFAQVLLHYVRVSAVIAIHTDSFASREWCRREILEAKRHNVPLVIANCVTDFEERGFPYMSNVPVIRLEPDATHRIGIVVARLLDEVMKDFLWRCRAELAKAPSDVTFLPRPPELISVAELVRKGTSEGTIVYPDPPIGLEEAELFAALGKGFRLRSYTQWLAELGA
jgi:hypothetical protein